MMLYPAMSELLEQVPSRYKLVNVVAARARKIAAKAERENIMLEDKPVSIAIREIAAGPLWDGQPDQRGAGPVRRGGRGRQTQRDCHPPG